VWWVTGRLNDSLPVDGLHEGIRVRSFPFGEAGGPAALWRAYHSFRSLAGELLERRAFDAAVGHQPVSGWAAGGLLSERSVPTVYFFHSPWHLEYLHAREPARPAWHPGARLRRWVEGRALDRFDRIALFSRFMAEQLGHSHPEAPAPDLVTPGVDIERFRPVADRREVRSRLGWPTDGPILFSMRRLVPRTGVDLLLEAFPRILERHPSTVLLLAGSGPERGRLEAMVRAGGLADRVRFLGYLRDEVLPDALAAPDLMVMPTRALEGLGLVTLESMAAGTPVAATPVGANPELLESIDPALLAPSTGPADLAGVIADYLDRGPSGMAESSIRCRREVETRFGWARTTDDIERIAGIVR
jgi:glycosyltransferase involved in cell wall biosynthesis